MECQNGDVEENLQIETTSSTKDSNNLPVEKHSLNSKPSAVDFCENALNQEAEHVPNSKNIKRETEDSKFTDNNPKSNSHGSSNDQQEQLNIDSSILTKDNVNGISDIKETFSTTLNTVDNDSENSSIDIVTEDSENRSKENDSSNEKNDSTNHKNCVDKGINVVKTTDLNESIKDNNLISNTREEEQDLLANNVDHITTNSDEKKIVHREDKIISSNENANQCEIYSAKESGNVDGENLINSKSSFKNANKDDELIEELNHILPSVDNSVYEAQIRSLELALAEEQEKKKQLADKLSNHDAAAKRAISKLQNEIKVRVEQVTKMYDEARRDKDSMVVKYAQAEQKQMETLQKFQNAARHASELGKEKETLLNRLRGLKNEKQKVVETAEAKNNDMRKLEQKIEALKDAITSADVKVKWAQNKLKLEMEAHKETKEKVEELYKRLKVAKEESEQIRRDCQSMIKTYQVRELDKTSTTKLFIKQNVKH